MKTYKKVTRKIENKVYCDLCGDCTTNKNFGSEYAVLEASWGYLSKHDGNKYEIHLCEKCFFLTLDWMKKIRSKNLNINDNNARFGKVNPLDEKK